MLPKTEKEIKNGGVYEQKVRCGKLKCRCANGSLHEGYFYYIRRTNGLLRKTYIPRSDVERVLKLVNQARSARAIERSNRYKSRNLFTDFQVRLREWKSGERISNAGGK